MEDPWYVAMIDLFKNIEGAFEKVHSIRYLIFLIDLDSALHSSPLVSATSNAGKISIFLEERRLALLYKGILLLEFLLRFDVGELAYLH